MARLAEEQRHLEIKENRRKHCLPGKIQMLTAKVISFLVKKAAENRRIASVKGKIIFQLLKQRKIIDYKIKRKLNPISDMLNFCVTDQFKLKILTRSVSVYWLRSPVLLPPFFQAFFSFFLSIFILLTKLSKSGFKII